MKRVIVTPDGRRTIPEWAECYCVSRHTPMYLHPFPWSFPDGEEIWICPNAHHQVIQLWAYYLKHGAPPTGVHLMKYTYFVRKTCERAWHQQVRLQAVKDEVFLKENLELEQHERLEAALKEWEAANER